MPHLPGDSGRSSSARRFAGGDSAHSVTTSRPSVQRFAEVYAAADGPVVSIHLSGEMSGTLEAARTAARDAPVPVEVVDSRSIGMGLGFVVLAAARAASEGQDLASVRDAAVRQARATRSLFYVDTLEHLRRGGRIGAAASLLGSALMIKPLLRISEGRIAPLEKVRTTSRALARLAELTVDLAGDREVDIAVQHANAPSRAEALATHLRARVPHLHDLHIGEVGPVLSAHVGPGMLGVAVSRRP